MNQQPHQHLSPDAIYPFDARGIAKRFRHAAIFGALDALRPWASINLHSFMGTIIPPRVTTPGDDRTYTGLAQAAFDAQTVRYRRLASYHFDAFTGEQEDHQHHVHKTWAVCLETFPIMASFAQHLRAPSAFWRFNPRDIDRWVDNDVPAMFAFFDAALALERPR